MKLVLSLAVAAGAVTLLFLWGGVRPGDVLRAAASIAPGTFALALAIQAGIYVFRAARLRGLLLAAGARASSLPRLTAASSAWILDSHVLPAKVGEASLVLHLSRIGVRAEFGLVGLLLSRLFDLATLLGILGVACLSMAGGGARPELPWLGTLGALLVAGAAALVVVILKGAASIALGRRALLAIGLGATRIGSRLDRFAARVEDALRRVGRGALVRAALWSLPVWASVLGVYAVLGVGVGLTGLGPFDLIFGASLAILGGLVPLNGFLGFGMLDMGWAWGFAAVGVAEDHAVATGLAFHTLYLVGVGVLGAAGHAVLAGARQSTDA